MTPFLRILLAALLCSTSLSSLFAVDESPTDAALREKLIGTWLVNQSKGELKAVGEVTLSHDGTFASRATITSPNGNFEYWFSGTWEVKNGVLVETISKHVMPERVGIVTRDTVVRVTEEEFEFKTEKGNVETRKRKKEAQ